MALSKVTYVDGVTIITAKNLNDIQDELIRQGEQQAEDEAELALKANTADVQTALALKADKSDTYTKAEVNEALGLKANTADVNEALALKADKTETYTKAQVDSIVEDAIAEAVKESEYSNFEMKSVSGDFIHITDGAGLIPVKDLKIGIDAVQEGSGDPSPENIRPISGWTGSEVTVQGINQWDEKWRNGYYKPTTGELVQSANYFATKNMIPVMPSTEYYFKCPARFEFFAYDKNKNFISKFNNNVRDSVFTTPENAYYINFNSYSSGTVITYNHNISMNYPSTDTDYHAYDGHVYSVTWETEAGTVYGGTLDVTTGVLVVDKGIVAINELSVQYEAQYTRFYASIYGASTKYAVRRVPYMCSAFFVVDDGRSFSEIPDYSIYGSGTTNTVYIHDSDYTSVADFVNAVGSQTIVYPLATPQTYQLTPTEVLTLLGENNIFADTGAVEELIYRISRQ